MHVSGDESFKSSKEIAPVKIVNGGLSVLTMFVIFKHMQNGWQLIFFKYFHSGSCSGIRQDTKSCREV